MFKQEESVFQLVNETYSVINNLHREIKFKENLIKYSLCDVTGKAAAKFKKTLKQANFFGKYCVNFTFEFLKGLPREILRNLYL